MTQGETVQPQEQERVQNSHKLQTWKTNIDQHLCRGLVKVEENKDSSNDRAVIIEAQKYLVSQALDCGNTTTENIELLQYVQTEILTAIENKNDQWHFEPTYDESSEERKVPSYESEAKDVKIYNLCRSLIQFGTDFLKDVSEFQCFMQNKEKNLSDLIAQNKKFYTQHVESQAMQQSMSFNIDNNENLELAQDFKQINEMYKSKIEARTDSLQYMINLYNCDFSTRKCDALKRVFACISEINLAQQIVKDNQEFKPQSPPQRQENAAVRFQEEKNCQEIPQEPEIEE